jgi:Peptidase family S41/N-terminal domain of Peptidase_S41 in eukaryotic IRBP
MDRTEVTRIVREVRALVEEHYVFPGPGAEVAAVLAAGLAAGRYPAGERELAAAVTADLQSVNGDLHLRLLHHGEPLAPRAGRDDSAEYEAMARWAGQTCGGVAAVRCLPGNVGYLDLQPVLFPTVLGGELLTAAMSLLAATGAVILDVRQCRGGEPSAVAFLVSYLCGHEPVQLTGLQGRDGLVRQSWTLPYVPGRRFGPAGPAYVLASGTTFSGGEQLAYDLQQLGRATVVGEPTRGGAHAREGFVVHPHLEATIPVAAAVSPVTGGSWEGTGVTPDVACPAGQAREVAHRRALEEVAAGSGPGAAGARSALAAAAAG